MKKKREHKILGSPERLARTTFALVMGAFVVSMIYVVIVLATTPADEDVTFSGRHRSEYVLMLLQCLLGIVGMLFPSFLDRRFRISVPLGMMVMYTVFLYGAIYLGEVRSFYYLVPYWDVILHFFSGVMLGCLGFSVVVMLNDAQSVHITLSRGYVAFFAFCFAVMIGVVWEIYEFATDGIFGTNMQKFMLEDGTMLVGRAALTDTMKDLIVDCCGAGLVCIAGCLSLRKGRHWLIAMMLRKITSSGSVEPFGEMVTIEGLEKPETRGETATVTADAEAKPDGGQSDSEK